MKSMYQKQNISSRNNKFQLNIPQADMETQMYKRMRNLINQWTINAG
jgi:hypothetical protein